MPLTEKNLFEQFEQLAQAVKQEFKSKGIVLPTQQKNGSIRIGTYSVVKRTGAYFIKNSRDRDVVGPLNLAQTAIIIANDLALGRWVDDQLIENDKWYGYKAFAEQAATACATKASKDKDPDKVDYILGKAAIACEQKLFYKKNIDSRFNKLCKLT